MFDNPVELEFTSSGHYCINFLKTNPVMQEGTEDEVLNIEHMEVGEKQKALIKLHKQFGHATYDRLAQLMNNAENTDAASLEILQTICENCEICIKNKRLRPRPVVGLPLASEFNETVAVDLHELDHGIWYLHIIDEFTRFGAGSIMR